MSLPTLPHVLTSLTEREAIADALYRAVEAFDRNDIPLFNSAFSKPDSDVVVSFNGKVIGLDALRSQLDFVGPMDTTHTISNMRIDVKEGAGTASLTAYALAQHCPPGRGLEPDGPKFLAASSYAADLVKDESDGLWKMKRWASKGIWRQGDSSVMQRPG